MKWLKVMMVFAAAMVSCSIASAQAPAPIPDQGPGQQQDPCVQLMNDINMCSAQCTAWDLVIQQKTATLNGANANLQYWQNVLNLFWQQIALQGEPMTPGQAVTLATITATIGASQRFIETTTNELQQAQQYFNQWRQLLQQAQQAYAAAGC